MFVFKRNQIIVTALVVMIAIAGYLNYTDRMVDEGEVVFHEELDATGVLVPNDDMAMPTMTEDEKKEDVKQEDTKTEDIKSKDAKAEEKKNNQEDQKKEDTVDPENVAKSSTEEDPGAAVFVNSSLDTPYFVQAKLDREQARAKQKEWLTEVLNNKNIDKEKKSQAADEMLTLQKRIEKETAAEAMIEAKGFDEVYVRIDDETVDVVVNAPTLSEAQIAQITDIVKRKTGIKEDNIRINPLKRPQN